MAKGVESAEVKLDEGDIEQALAENRLSVQYQPIVPLSDHQTILGVEALVRYQHPDLGMVMPGKFMPCFVEQGRLADLTYYVVRHIGQDWKAWIELGHELKVSVNLDYSLLADPSLPRELASILEAQNMPRRNLLFEIAGIPDSRFSESAVEQLTRLRMKGFRLSLDNQGVSPLELSAIGDLPIDQLKIDRAVICALRNRPQAQNSVRQILDAGSRCGAEVVAVGIESEWALEWLRRNGCQGGQGYLFGPSLAPDAFRQIYLESQQRWRVSSQPDRVNLLVVDDDPQYQVLFFETFSDTYQVAVANSVADARQLFATHQPKLLVLDVILPDGSGVDLCREFTEQYGKDSFSTIFISGKDDVDVRLEAYSAGGVDFLQKPFSMVDLVAKLARAAGSQQEQQQMQTRSDELRSAALGSMREAAHYGDVVQFMKNLFQAHDEHAIGGELFRFMRNKQLTCSVQFRSPQSRLCLNQDGRTCSPMEINIFELLHDRGRIQDFNQRTIFNDHHVSVLIKNMPDEDDERGRIKDYMAALIEGLEARFTDILRRRTLESVSGELNTLARELGQNLADDKARNREMMEKASLDLQMSFHLLELTEEQEAHITRIIESMHNNAEESEISAERTSERVQNLVELLSRVVDMNKPADQSPSPDKGNDSIELF